MFQLIKNGVQLVSGGGANVESILLEPPRQFMLHVRTIGLKAIVALHGKLNELLHILVCVGRVGKDYSQIKNNSLCVGNERLLK